MSAIACTKCNGTGKYKAQNGVITLCGSCHYRNQALKPMNWQATRIPRAVVCPCYENAANAPYEITCSICLGKKRVPIPMTELYNVADINAYYGWTWWRS